MNRRRLAGESRREDGIESPQFRSEDSNLEQELHERNHADREREPARRRLTMPTAGELKRAKAEESDRIEREGRGRGCREIIGEEEESRLRERGEP